MARSTTITAFERNVARNCTYIRVGRSEIEIPAADLPGIRQWIREQFDELDETLVAIAMACWLARDNNFSTPNQMVGRTITLDLQGRLNYPDSVFRVS